MSQSIMALACAETFDMSDADLRATNPIVRKAFALLTVQDMIDLRVQPHLLK